MSIREQARRAQSELEDLASNGRVYYVHDQDRHFSGAAVITENENGVPIVVVGISAVHPNDQFSRPLGRLITTRRVLSYALRGVESNGVRVFYPDSDENLQNMVESVLNGERDSNSRFVAWIRGVCELEYVFI